VVEHGNTMRQVHGMVQGKQGNASAQEEMLGQGEGFGDEQIGRRRIFPPLGDVFANPGLAKTETIGQDELRYVAVVRIGKGAGGGVERHHE
jgi:hypothetical protein